jgi:hypothetical protein
VKEKQSKKYECSSEQIYANVFGMNGIKISLHRPELQSTVKITKVFSHHHSTLNNDEHKVMATGKR